ncbi:unnamed protein product [Arabis nemorensis]|uniref:Uncharacterized protein n=1 Tax=Arabis nemorensis TaxID=586526 RepID=A0A565C7G0_9BRAS|nr:unnamed protein product [Arabis nemorensis]
MSSLLRGRGRPRCYAGEDVFAATRVKTSSPLHGRGRLRSLRERTSSHTPGQRRLHKQRPNGPKTAQTEVQSSHEAQRTN